MSLSDLDIQTARDSRRHLALMRCRCDSCDERDIYTCEVCGHFRPACLLGFAETKEAVCLKECKR